MLEWFVLAPGLPRSVEQLPDHLLEDDGVVRQRRRGVGQRRRGVREAGVGCGTVVCAHIHLDAQNRQIIRCIWERLQEIRLVQPVRPDTGR